MLTACPLWRLIGPLGASAVGILLAVVLLLVLFLLVLAIIFTLNH